MPVLHAFDVLTKSPAKEMPAVTFLVGGDGTLRYWAREHLSAGSDLTEYDGEKVPWHELLDELSTASLFSFGERRTVLVRNGEGLLKDHRDALQNYVAAPSSASCLIMEFVTLPSNTKAFKAASANGLVVQCKSPVTGFRGASPDLPKLRAFLTKFVAPRHQCSIDKMAAERLIDHLGDDLGMLDTEIAKLAVNLPVDGEITAALVDEVVTGWQAKDMWGVVELAAAGNAADALRHLDHLMDGGQRPIALLPQLAWSLRRLGMVTAIVDASEQKGQKPILGDALSRVGFKPGQHAAVTKQLQQLTRERARQILSWLLEADLKLKSSHSSDGPDRWVLEELVLKLARAAK